MSEQLCQKPTAHYCLQTDLTVGLHHQIPTAVTKYTKQQGDQYYKSAAACLQWPHKLRSTSRTTHNSVQQLAAIAENCIAISENCIAISEIVHNMNDEVSPQDDHLQ
jgi:hypothetical protein